MAGPAAAQGPRFSDVSVEHHAFEAVEWAAAAGVTVGYGDGTFKPERSLSRRHAVVFMQRYYDRVLGAGQSTDFTRGDMMVLLKAVDDGSLRSADAPDETTPASWQGPRFSDVSAEHHAFEAVEWAAAAGVTVGYGDGTFKPERSLSRRHAVVFMQRYYDRVLGAGQSTDFTRGDMMVLLKAVDDGSLREGRRPQGSNDGVPLAVVTPRGIPVEVLGLTEAGYSVRGPCGGVVEVSTGVPIESVRVVIDPGHGGRWDTGAVGPNGLAESDLNLTLSRAVLDELAGRGITATTTRTGDYPVVLSVRGSFAEALRADALVSIHHNAPTWSRRETPGSEVYVQSATAHHARADSARLGGLLYQEITTALATFDGIAWSGLPSAGVMRVLNSRGDDSYGMIRRPSVPTALVEYGYLSNPSEAELFATSEYIRVAAAATADAIEAYLNSDRLGAELAEPRWFNAQRAPACRADPALE